MVIRRPELQCSPSQHFRNKPLSSCLMSLLAVEVVNWLTISSAVWLYVLRMFTLIPACTHNGVRPTLFTSFKKNKKTIISKLSGQKYWRVVPHYIQQQPHYFRLAIEGSLVQSGPRFGGSVDVDAGFKEQPGKWKQKHALWDRRQTASIQNLIKACPHPPPPAPLTDPRRITNMSVWDCRIPTCRNSGGIILSQRSRRKLSRVLKFSWKDAVFEYILFAEFSRNLNFYFFFYSTVACRFTWRWQHIQSLVFGKYREHWSLRDGIKKIHLWIYWLVLGKLLKLHY